MIYLDYAASCPMFEAAVTKLMDSSLVDFANLSQSHRLGREIYNRVEKVRDQFRVILDCDQEDKFIFTSSATEANNMAIKGLKIRSNALRIIYSKADNPSITGPVFNLKNRIDSRVIIEDFTDIDEVESFTDVGMVILSHVNNQSGVSQDIFSMATKIKNSCKDTHIHVDAAQSFGKIPISLKDGLIDSLSVSAHKMGGPKGVAGLYIKRGVLISPLLDGGGQEGGLRSSTVAAPLILSFGEAANICNCEMDKNFDYISQLKERAINLLKSEISEIQFPFENNFPYILTFILPDVPSAIMLRHLEQSNIFISTTSACSSKIKKENEVLKSLKIPTSYHKFVLRVSFFIKTKESEVDIFCKRVVEIYYELRKLL